MVPVFDEVAPVLENPVQHGIHGLAQGSLLQGFALTVGSDRIAEDSVARAIDILLAGDTVASTGEGRAQIHGLSR